MNIVKVDVQRLWTLIEGEATSLDDADWLLHQAREHRRKVLGRTAYELAWNDGTKRAALRLGLSPEWTGAIIKAHLAENPGTPPPAGHVVWLPPDADDITLLALPE